MVFFEALFFPFFVNKIFRKGLFDILKLLEHDNYKPLLRRRDMHNNTYSDNDKLFVLKNISEGTIILCMFEHSNGCRQQNPKLLIGYSITILVLLF